MNLCILATASLIMLCACNGNTATAQKCDPVTVAAPAAEVMDLRQYLTANKITATADSRGFYYTIVKAGSGTKPTACSTVKVNYAGSLTNGSQFDANNGIEFPLNNLIVGWQEGIPLVAPGGRIVLYLPPSLAYGSQAQQGIPANSILVFTIDLLEAK